MTTFFMLGKYSESAFKGIGAGRTETAVGIIEKYNGQVVSMYAVLGQFDLVFIVNLPGVKEAMEASVELTEKTGIIFETSAAMTINRYDDIITRDRGDG